MAAAERKRSSKQTGQIRKLREVFPDTRKGHSLIHSDIRERICRKTPKALLRRRRERMDTQLPLAGLLWIVGRCGQGQSSGHGRKRLRLL